MSEAIRLLLADDHAMVRESLAAALASIDDVEVVGLARDGIEALRLIREQQPAVAVVDLHLPGRTGIEVARSLSAEGHSTRVLIVTSFDDEPNYREALAAGAAGFMGKGASVERVLDGIRALARGETWFLSAVSERAEASGAPRPPHRDNPLSRREREVLRLIATGLTTPEIAERLGTRPGTVKNQTSSILQKLEVTDRTRAALVALREGWL
ncbi:MAG: response regulator transcription factor [Myxococcota bacterium]